MKEKLQEIYDGLKERLKSPFLLTFIFVWGLHNWEFVYSLFTFNSEIPYVTRIAFLKAYLIVHNYTELLWLPLAWTFASIGLYFFGSFLSEGINLIYNKWIRTWLYLVIDKNKLKTEDDYNSLELRRKKLQELVFDLRRKEEDAALKLKTVDEILNKTIAEQRDEIAKYLSQSVDREKNIADKIIEIENNKKENENIKESLEKSKLSLEVLQVNYDELQSFKTWAERNRPYLFNTWRDRDTNTKFNELIKDKSDLQLNDIIDGNWILKYTRKINSTLSTGSEKVTIDNFNSYFANDRHVFNLSNISINIATKKITFSKIKLDGNLHADEDLNIINDSLITGHDSGGYTLEYRRDL
ncbi:MAG: hypothetical protein ABIP51_09100 [Bacteroidia bacterium]